MNDLKYAGLKIKCTFVSNDCRINAVEAGSNEGRIST